MLMLRDRLPSHNHIQQPPGCLLCANYAVHLAAIVAKHYYASQIIFCILQGLMGVKDEGKDPVTLEAGDFLPISPRTVHEHWNMSATVPLVFLEY